MLLLTLALVTTTLATSAPATAGPRARARVRPTGECRVVSFTPVLAEQTNVSSRKSERARRRMMRKRRFPATRTLDLKVGVRLGRRVKAKARLELRVYTPRGHLYQTLRVEAPAPNKKASKRRRYARLRRILRPRTGTLPIAGTAIVNHSLYGRWKVEPHLDGNPTPCGRARSFRIDP